MLKERIMIIDINVQKSNLYSRKYIIEIINFYVSNLHIKLVISVEAIIIYHVNIDMYILLI